MDRRNYGGVMPGVVTESQLAYAAGIYANLSKYQNPDGSPGVNAHFDVEYSCGGPGDVDGITSLCGPFGGANLVTMAPTGGQVCCSASFVAPNLMDNRVGRFHWIFRDATDAGGTCWTLDTARPGGASCVSGLGATVAHELGHQLGLMHWGDSASLEANGKPNYPSLMNYTYSYALNDTPNIRFSDGAVAGVSPANLSETTNFSGDSALVDISFLSGGPYYYQTQPGFPRHVDWNRDGSFDPSVRANAVSHSGSFGRDRPTAVDNQDFSSAWLTHRGVGAAGWKWQLLPFFDFPTTWLVWNEDASSNFRASWSSDSVGGWSTPVNLGGNMRDDSEPSAAVFVDGQGVESLVVFGADAVTSEITYALVDQDSNHSAWTRLANPANVTFKDASAARLGNNLYLVASDLGTSQVYLGRFANNVAGWTGWVPVVYPPDPVVSVGQSPAVAAGPEGLLYVVVKSSLPQRTNQLDMYTFDPATGVWNVKDATYWRLPEGGCVPSGRPGLTFAPHRDAAGAPLPSGNGALWLVYPVQGPGCYSSDYDRNIRYRWTWGQLNATTQSATMSVVHIPPYGDWDTCYSGPYSLSGNTGVAVAAGKASVQAFAVQAGSNNWQNPNATACPSQKRVFHVPHADGTVSLTYEDHDDERVIRDNLCLSLNLGSECKCANFNITCSTLPFTEEYIECLPAP